MSGSWVTTTMVVPSRLSSWNSAISSTEVRLSSAPVGSSASSTFGALTSARAMATRCCCPPEVGAGIDHGQFHIARGVEPLQQVEQLEHEADLVAAHRRKRVGAERRHRLAV